MCVAKNVCHHRWFICKIVFRGTSQQFIWHLSATAKAPSARPSPPGGLWKKNMAILGAFFGSLLVACYPKKLVFRKRSPQGCARWHANSFFRFEQSILRQRSWTQPRIDNLKIWWSWYIILSIKIWQRILQKTTLGTLPDDELSSLLPSVQTKEIKAVRDSTELRAMLWAANSPTLSHCPLTLSMASLESLLHTQKAILYFIISYKYRLSKEV